MSEKELARNRRAFYDYEILERYEAGIALLGTEIKSLRNSGGNLSEGYIKVIRNELWLVGASIAPYSLGSAHNHEERRDRKLLMHKREIERLKEVVQQKGLTLIPIALYLKQGRVKIAIGYGRGKKKGDKRNTLIEREKKREMDRAMKQFTR